MPRQLQDNGGRVRQNFTAVVPRNKGGTGGTTPAEARTNLNLLGKPDLDIADGVAKVASNGFLPADYFESGSVFQPTILGPSVVTKGSQVYLIVSNYFNDLDYTVSGSSGLSAIQKNGPYILFQVNTNASDEEILTINANGVATLYALAVVAEGDLNAPEFVNLDPSRTETVSEGFTLYLKPPMVYGSSNGFTAIDPVKGPYFTVNNVKTFAFQSLETNAVVPVTPGDAFIHLRGYAAEGSWAYVTFGGKTYHFDDHYREFYINVSDLDALALSEALRAYKDTGGLIEYYIEKAPAVFTKLKVQFSKSSSFTSPDSYDIAFDERNSLVDRFQLKSNLSSGLTYFRCRYELVYRQTNTTVLTPWSDTLELDIVEATPSYDNVNGVFASKVFGGNGVFGTSLAYDAQNRQVLVGVPLATAEVANLNAGRIEVFGLSSTRDEFYHQNTVVKSKDNPASVRFGNAIAINRQGTRLFVGENDNRVHVYSRETPKDDWSYMTVIENPEPSYLGFGYAIATEGDRVWISNTLVPNQDNGSGRVYTYVENKDNASYQRVGSFGPTLVELNRRFGVSLSVMDLSAQVNNVPPDTTAGLQGLLIVGSGAATITELNTYNTVGKVFIYKITDNNGISSIRATIADTVKGFFGFSTSAIAWNNRSNSTELSGLLAIAKTNSGLEDSEIRLYQITINRTTGNITTALVNTISAVDTSAWEFRSVLLSDDGLSLITGCPGVDDPVQGYSGMVRLFNLSAGPAPA